MACGNKEHLTDKSMNHACGVCKHWNIDVIVDEAIREPCLTCKTGDCKFEHC